MLILLLSKYIEKNLAGFVSANVLITEKGYALSNKLTGIRAQQKELQNEYDSLNKADAYQTMVDRLVKEMSCLPVGWWVTPEDREYIVDCIKGGW